MYKIAAYLFLFFSTGALSLTETTYRVGDNSNPIYIKKWAQVEEIELYKGATF